MSDLIPPCAGVLSQAEMMVKTQQQEIVGAAKRMVEIAYEWANEERMRWADARDKVGGLEKAFGTNPEIAELAGQMAEIADAWQECEAEYQTFLSSFS